MEPRTPEHQARVEKMRAKLHAMTEEERRETVTVLDHVMGFGDDEIDDMSEEELDALLRAEGIDPDASFHGVMGGVLAGLSKTCMDLRAQLREAEDNALRLWAACLDLAGECDAIGVARRCARKHGAAVPEEPEP